MKYYKCNTLVIYLSTNIKRLKMQDPYLPFLLFDLFKFRVFYEIYIGVGITHARITYIFNC